MAWRDNPVTRNLDGTAYIIRETAGGLPYAVVPKAADPDNKYDFTVVATFWADLPDGDPKKLQASPPPPDPEPTVAQKLDAYEKNVSAYLKAFVKQRKYQDVVDCVSYMHSLTGQKYVEARYVSEAREAVWAAWYELRGKVEAGTETIPASWTDVQGRLPVLTWPPDYQTADGDLVAKSLAPRMVSADTGNKLTVGGDKLLHVAAA